MSEIYTFLGRFFKDDMTGEIANERHLSFIEKIMKRIENGRRQAHRDEIRKGQQYILIKTCEAQIKGDQICYNPYDWDEASSEKKPENVVILSEKEYIKNEKRNAYYRRYSGSCIAFIRIEENEMLAVDKVEEIHGFFLCTVKGRGTLYTREKFEEKILSNVRGKNLQEKFSFESLREITY